MKKNKKQRMKMKKNKKQRIKIKINKKQMKESILLNSKDWLKKLIKKIKTSKSKYSSPPNPPKKRRQLKKFLNQRMRYQKILITY